MYFHILCTENTEAVHTCSMAYCPTSGAGTRPTLLEGTSETRDGLVCTERPVSGKMHTEHRDVLDDRLSVWITEPPHQ